MDCTVEEFMQYIEEEDIKFIRLAFCDVFGVPKNISVMPSDLPRAFKHGIAINGSFINGFAETTREDLFLHPDMSTTTLLPWRPDHGKVIRMFCDITYHDGTPFEADTRRILKDSVAKAKEHGVNFQFGSRMEFYLFKTDEEGNPTDIPYDHAGYMDIAPLDKGENVRREICLTLERMGIQPINSHHEAGPGQNEIDFKSADPLTAADHVSTFITVVKTIAARNGLYADFSPKPLKGYPGNGYHINLRACTDSGEQILPNAIAGILKHISECTVFFNPMEESYDRLGEGSAPRFVTWSKDHRSQLIRIPPAKGTHHYAQLRSPDANSNPYLTNALLIESALEGILNKYELQAPTNTEPEASAVSLETLPLSLKQAREKASDSEFLKKVLDPAVADCYIK